MEDLFFASAVRLATAIRNKEVSSVEVVETCLRRIEAVNPSINAVVLLTADMALEEARTADESLSRGEVCGPLHGVPMTIKDALETAGVISTGGTQGRAAFVPAEDAITVSRMRSAGAILLGKTNLPEFSMAFESDNLVYGRTNNPYDLSRTPGGSTGGESAIIAAGGSPIGLGSDAGGSIRQPCHFCGIAGIKPTSGRVPRTGHWPRFDGLQDSFTQVGPMARFVEDLALILPIIAGVDWRDPYIVPMPLGDPKEVDLTTLRVATYTDNGIRTPDAESTRVVQAAVRALADAGVNVEETRPDMLNRSHEVTMSMFRADAGSAVRKLLEAAGTQKVSPLLLRSLESQGSKEASAQDLSEWIRGLDRFRSAMLSFMERYDAIVCPVNAYPAMLHGTTWDDDLRSFSYTQVFNATGWPAAVVRGGVSSEGLPIGVQVAAKPWREDVALAVAKHLEDILGGWQAPPL